MHQIPTIAYHATPGVLISAETQLSPPRCEPLFPVPQQPCMRGQSELPVLDQVCSTAGVLSTTGRTNFADTIELLAQKSTTAKLVTAAVAPNGREFTRH